eukprot:5680439-Alexandrium_andersonii.AAC.1
METLAGMVLLFGGKAANGVGYDRSHSGVGIGQHYEWWVRALAGEGLEGLCGILPPLLDLV